MGFRIRKLLAFHCLRMYVRILSSCLNTPGLRKWFFYYLFKVPAKLIYVFVSMSLDNIFFPKYRDVKVEKPIFLIGHPRSGTTFMHTVLTQTADFAVFKNWEINHPSLIARKLLQHSGMFQTLFDVLVAELRFTPHTIKQAIRKRKSPKRYENYLGDVAQEEEVLFTNILDTQFITFCTPLAFVERGFPEVVFHDDQPHQEKSALFLKGCFKRQIYHTGKKQIFAKMNGAMFRIKSLLKVFPDAKIIYLVRSPLETNPSHLSRHRTLVDENFGLENISEASLQQYYKHKYENNILFYKHVDELLRNNVIPKDQMIEITYDSIKKDLGTVFARIKDFTGIKFSPELEERLEAQVKKQSSYERKHKNLPLESFNLTEEKIRADFDFVFQRYGF